MSFLHRLRPRTLDALWLAGLLAAALLVYGTSLTYPFFWVDPIDIGLAASRDIPTILTNSQGYLYYRPFAFMLWKALYTLSGRYDPFAFHLVHVVCHTISAWLFYALARRILGDRTPAGIAGLLFVWYPASYQAVTWVISPQVQAMPFLLGSAIAYTDGRTRGDRRRIILSLLLLAIALPFHENAASFGFVIAALEGFFVAGRRIGEQEGRRVSPWPLAHLAICAAFAALWFAVPKDPDSAVARFEPAAGWYLLQGAIWPVAGAVGWWRDGLDGPAWQPLILTAPMTLLFLLAAYAYARRLPLFGLGLSWFAAMTLPIWATRGISYVGISPRVFYIAAPGAILTWAGLLSLDLRSPNVNRVWKMGLGLLTALIVVQSAAFLGVRKDVHDQATTAIWDVVRIGQSAGDEASLLFVNAPDQITPRLREYPVGFFRAILMPVSVDLGQYTELQTGVRPATTSLSVPWLAELENYPHQVDMRGPPVGQAELSAAIRAADGVYLTEYEPGGRVRVVEAGSVTPAAAEPYQATFGGRAGLVDATLTPEGDRRRVALIWECLARFDRQDTIFLHAVDGDRLVAQSDGDPLRGLFPLSECRPGERIRDVRFIEAPPGADIIRVGIYNRLTGERLIAIDANGQSLPDHAVVIGQVTR